MFNKKIFVVTFALVIFSLVLFFGVHLIQSYRQTVKSDKLIVAGLKPTQQEYFSKQLHGAFREVELLEKGDDMIRQGKLDDAIRYFENLINDRSFEMKGMVRNHLIDAYEKNKDYKKAYQILQEKVRTFVVPVSDEARIPHEERLIYLKYASQGGYESAIKHAQVALDASKKDKILKNLSKLYQQRLDDLIAAKEYILSLKKTQ